jgi:hypothetical protein
MSEYNVSVGMSGIRREIGEVISITKAGITFQFKKPRSSKRVQIEISPKNLFSLKENGIKSEVVFVSPTFDLVDYSSITNVEASEMPGISVGTTKQGDKLYFSHNASVTSLVSKVRKARKDKTKKVKNKVKKTKGKVVKPTW